MRISRLLAAKPSIPFDYNALHPVDQCLVSTRFAYRYRHKEARDEKDVCLSDFDRATEAAISSVQKIQKILLLRKEEEETGNAGGSDAWSRMKPLPTRWESTVNLYDKKGSMISGTAKDVHAACAALHTAGLYTVCPELVEPLIGVVVDGCTKALVHASKSEDSLLFEQSALHWGYAVREWELLEHSETMPCLAKLCGLGQPPPSNEDISEGAASSSPTGIPKRPWLQHSLFREVLTQSSGSDEQYVLDFQPAIFALIGLQMSLIGRYCVAKSRIYSVSTALRTLVVPTLAKLERLGNQEPPIDGRKQPAGLVDAQRQLVRSTAESLRECGMPLNVSSISPDEVRRVCAQFTLGNALMVHHALTQDERIKPFHSAFAQRDPPFTFDTPRLALLLSEKLWKSFREVCDVTTSSSSTRIKQDDSQQAPTPSLIQSRLLTPLKGTYYMDGSALQRTLSKHPQWLVTCIPESCRGISCGRLEYLHCLPPAVLWFCPRAICGFLMRSILFQARLETRVCRFIPILRGITGFVQNALSQSCSDETGGDESEMLSLVSVIKCCAQSLSFRISCANVEDSESFQHRSTIVHEMRELDNAIRVVQQQLLALDELPQPLRLHSFFEGPFAQVDRPTSLPAGFKPRPASPPVK